MSIKGHKTIDLADPHADFTIALRAKVWDPKKLHAASTVDVTLGVYTKKVNGDPVPGAPASNSVSLTLRTSDTDKKVKHYSLAPKLVGVNAFDLWQCR